ncbi:hypothetical protein Tco_0027882 [Tanacetum coccineum]
MKKTRYAVSGKVDTAYWDGFLGVRAAFKSISDIIPNLLDKLYLRIVIVMDTAYVDNMDTPLGKDTSPPLKLRINNSEAKLGYEGLWLIIQQSFTISTTPTRQLYRTYTAVTTE